MVASTARLAHRTVGGHPRQPQAAIRVQAVVLWSKSHTMTFWVTLPPASRVLHPWTKPHVAASGSTGEGRVPLIKACHVGGSNPQTTVNDFFFCTRRPHTRIPENHHTLHQNCAKLNNKLALHATRSRLANRQSFMTWCTVGVSPSAPPAARRSNSEAAKARAAAHTSKQHHLICQACSARFLRVIGSQQARAFARCLMKHIASSDCRPATSPATNLALRPGPTNSGQVRSFPSPCNNQNSTVNICSSSVGHSAVRARCAN